MAPSPPRPRARKASGLPPVSGRLTCGWCGCFLRSTLLARWRLGHCGTCIRRLNLAYAPPPCPRQHKAGLTFKEAWLTRYLDRPRADGWLD